MATYFLINSVLVGSDQYFAGDMVDDASTDTSKLLLAGALLWDTADVTVAAAATVAQNARKYRGANEAVLSLIMQSAVQSSQRAVGAVEITGANLAALTAGKGASLVGIQDVGNLYVATTVEAAFAEIKVAATSSLLGLMSALDKKFLDAVRAIYGTALTNTASQTIQSSEGYWRRLSALGQNGVLTLGVVGAVLGDTITITRNANGNFTYAVVNGGGGAGTIYTFVEGQLGFIQVQFDGTDWVLKGHGQLVQAASTAFPGTQSAADKKFEDSIHAAAGANLVDAATQTIASPSGWAPLPTLSQGGALTLGTTGSVAGDQYRVLRTNTSAFAYAVINGGVGAGTMFTFPASLGGHAVFQYDGTNWALKELSSTIAATATLPGTMTAAAFNLLAAASPVYYARGVVLTNVADRNAFVVSQNGVTYVAGDVVLLANQTTAAECGLYLVGTVAGTAPLTRIAALPIGAAYVNGCTVQVSEGTIFPGSTWKSMATGAKVVGTHDPLFYPRVCQGTLTLASGTYTLGATEGLYLFSTALALHCTMNTPGGVLTLTNGYGSNTAGRTAGKSGTAAATVISRITAGTIDAANNSTVDWSVQNW